LGDLLLDAVLVEQASAAQLIMPCSWSMTRQS